MHCNYTAKLKKYYISLDENAASQAVYGEQLGGSRKTAPKNGSHLKPHKRLSEPFTESREPFIGAISKDYIKREILQLEHLWILNHRIQITQETPEESYYRQNLGRIRRVKTVDKTMEPSGDGSPVIFQSK